MKFTITHIGLITAAGALLASVLPGFVDSWQLVLERAELLVLFLCY